MNDDNKILSKIADAIIELPYMFKADGQLFYLYPPSLGVLLMIKKVYETLGLKESENMLELKISVKENKDKLAFIVALCTYENRKDCIKEYYNKERTKIIEKVSDNDILSLMLIINNWATDINDFIKCLSLDNEHKYLKRVHEIKNRDGSSYTFNGKSIYGTLIDVLCERYGWTMDYVVWGVSHCNINMLLADHVATVLLTKDEKKKISIPRDRTTKVGMLKSKESVSQLLNMVNNG